MKVGLSLLLICSCLTIIGCKENTVEKDMAEYCDCVKEQSQKKRRSRNACRMLLKDITASYKDDTLAMRYINEHRYDCTYRRGSIFNLKFNK